MHEQLTEDKVVKVYLNLDNYETITFKKSDIYADYIEMIGNYENHYRYYLITKEEYHNKVTKQIDNKKISRISFFGIQVFVKPPENTSK